MIKTVNSEGFELKNGIFFPFQFDPDQIISLDLLNKFWGDWKQVLEEMINNEK